MSTVFFTNLHTRPGVNLPLKMERLLKAAGLEQMPLTNAITAVKLHFGELGNVAYVRHNYLARLVELLNKQGARPFLTDSNTLYSGSRSNAIDHIQTAFLNGFNPVSVPGAPVIIADGLRGTDQIAMNVPSGKYCRQALIGSAIAQADAVISVTHFKGHEQTTFGGSLKNLGMGSASVGGKLFLHSDSKPVFNKDNCIGCGLCVRNCAHDAVHLSQERKAVLDPAKCVGCGQCIAVCQSDAAQVADYCSTQDLSGKIAEYAAAVVHGKPQLHVTFITNVSPNCDCWGLNDVAIVPDLGMLASTDPVALDQACVDKVIEARALAGSLANPHGNEDMIGKDKLHHIHPQTDGVFGLEHAQAIGLGERTYKLIEI